MRALHSADGFSLAESLLAVALIAGASAAMLPAMAQAARLHRDSDLQTSAILAAAARLERLKTAAAAGLPEGGSIDTAIAGWHAWVDADGRLVESARGVFECRWTLSTAAHGVLVAAVRVEPRAAPHAVVTLSTAVRRE